MDWYYWLIIIGVLIVFYILLYVRQKRQEKQNKENLESFKVGDKVITHIGVFGKIKRIYNTTYGKICVLEIGTTNKVDIEIDLRYIAAIDEKTIAPEEPKEEKSESKQAVAEEPKTEDSKNKKEQSEKNTKA